MSYHILHLLSPQLQVRIELDQLKIKDRTSGEERSVPLADVAVIVAAAPDTRVTTAALRRMAELNVLLLICNQKFEPVCVTLPYYRPPNTELLRQQIKWTQDWQIAQWRQVIAAKVANQAALLQTPKRVHRLLQQIAKRCAHPPPTATVNNPPADLSRITEAQRDAYRSWTPDACESRAARHYWKHYFAALGTDEHRRTPRTREGINGLLDYGYAILRTAVLRSLAAHGFIAALGIAHAAKAGSFALADDLMEPLRPWVDQQLIQYLQTTDEPDIKEWMPQAVQILQQGVTMARGQVRLLNAIDDYVRSFAHATTANQPLPLNIPRLQPPHPNREQSTQPGR